MSKALKFFLLVLFAAPFHILWAQDQYDRFTIENNDVIWRHTYEFPGLRDSLRREVVQMLKSKFFTFNVIRNEAGYNGEIRHYQVDCKRYGRTYTNTPRMYWDGEWTGKFIVDVFDNRYTVTVYALYYEKMQRTSDYYRTEKPVKGRYLDAVTKKNKTEFRKSEFANLALMSVALRDQFDIRYALPVNAPTK